MMMRNDAQWYEKAFESMMVMLVGVKDSGKRQKGGASSKSIIVTPCSKNINEKFLPVRDVE
jgi:hypothetical protein